ncbi:polyphosphate kinase 1 [Rubidibacter lacunae KORDI 51-2]|uniref:Polyphosphate kinase n=1 Tax=Rubidibacter lacunae KORDI 51-2 TaxID=582515 RepID=U5DI34_9CHRO|nr:polyphosphate kinase 1 [Rubidibacter lacunae]ERN40264.1 polyphosphate kinase 1 [Rubidibacter lacunae KORDI 51-2]
MSESTTATPPVRLDSPDGYFNRELSWLEFNYRVLAEALDERTPLLERLKFTAIFCSNLDEFFMVRVAGLKKQVEAGVSKLTPDGRSPMQQLADISARLHPLMQEHSLNFEQALRLKLTDVGAYIIKYVDLNQEQRAYYQNFFEAQVFPVLTPLAVYDPGHPFPYISNLSLNLIVVLREPQRDKELFARIKVPKSKSLPRFVPLPEHLRPHRDGKPAVWAGVPLEQIVAHNLDALFAGMTIQECYAFRITRNADIAVEEDEADDLLLAIEQELRKRRIGGSVVRMEIEAIAPPAIRAMLMEQMQLCDRDVYDIDGMLGLGDVMALRNLPLPELKDPEWVTTVPQRLQRFHSAQADDDPSTPDEFFAEIRKGDILVHHPYHSFAATVQQFIDHAARDPQVLGLKMTMYRTSGDSPIANTLIAAAEAGKEVAVLVELKARFDEANNIVWARRLESSGVHVAYGVVGLKTHTKIALVVRREGELIRRYVHIGTGNYNPKTARLYTDLGLLSCRENLGSDLTDLFNFLTAYSHQRAYRKLLVAPVSLRSRMVEMIQRERDLARAGGSGRIVAKMNSLVDPEIIANLYEASQAGVKVDAIVRGICCLRPGVAGVSDNIRVISIIGRYLEHSRIFYFHNGGDEEIYIGSADWMQRNLDRRVEAVTPVEDETSFRALQEVLGVMLSDNRQAWELQSDGSYIQRRPADGEAERSTHRILTENALKAAVEETD